MHFEIKLDINSYDAERRIAKLITADHCNVCTSKLNVIRNLFALSKVGTSHYVSIFAPTSMYITPGYTLSTKFSTAISKLNDPSIIKEEISYIKSNPDYIRFVNSVFYEELKLRFTQFLDNGSQCRGMFFRYQNIKSCVLSYPQNASSGKDTTFDFSLVTDCYDDGAYEKINLMGGTYRRLSLRETSMLAVALSDDFPQYFTVQWFRNIDDTNYSINISLCLVPEFKPKENTSTNTVSPKDLY